MPLDTFPFIPNNLYARGQQTFSVKGQFGLCGPFGCTYSTLPLWNASSHRHYINESGWLVYKTSFMDTEI